MAEAAHLKLPDGRGIDFHIRTSGRARSVWLRVTPRHGLIVTVPPGVTRPEVMRLVANKAEWVARHLDALGETVPDAFAAGLVPPERIELRALAECWQLEYRQTAVPTVNVRADGLGRLLLTGAVGEAEVCNAALRRWLARHAKSALEPWLDRVAREAGLRYSGLSVRNQRSRWGSCSHQGRISLNCKLLFLPPELVRYVMTHELCHTLEHNHSSRFWAAVRRLEPDLDEARAQMRGAWRLVPAWAHPPSLG